VRRVLTASYRWQFVPEPSTQKAPGVSPALPNGFTDSGSSSYHAATAKVPAVPTSFTASAGNGTVHLAWAAPAGTPPTSDDGAPTPTATLGSPPR
jgi:hypothetical protein